MVSMNPNSPEGFYSDANGMDFPGLKSFPTTAVITESSPMDDLNKKVRKPYTITKSRESWTEPEHDKFLEALQLFDRDWKKIEAFVGSKTVIQIRSHAQKYFLKVQKSGSNEHLPPPRPKRKASYPYPQKAPKNATATATSLPQPVVSFHSSPLFHEPGLQKTDSVRMPRHPSNSEAPSSWVADSQTVVVPNAIKVLPDFVQVYRFIGSVFDPEARDHLCRLRKMDPIDVETVLLLMRNLSINLVSPDFEDHRRLLASYDIDSMGPNKSISGS